MLGVPATRSHQRYRHPQLDRHPQIECPIQVGEPGSAETQSEGRPESRPKGSPEPLQSFRTGFRMYGAALPQLVMGFLSFLDCCLGLLLLPVHGRAELAQCRLHPSDRMQRCRSTVATLRLLHPNSTTQELAGYLWLFQAFSTQTQTCTLKASYL